MSTLCIPAPAPADVRPRRVLAAVSAALFVDALLYGAVVPILPLYARELGVSAAAIGVLFAAYAVGLLVATPVLAAVADRFGRRRPLLAGSFGLTAATLLFAAAGSYPLLVAARFLQGAAAAAVWTAGVALVAATVPPRRLGAAMGVAMASMSAGLILGPAAGGLLAEAAGPHAPFLAAAVAAALSGVVQLVVAVEPPGPRRRPTPVRVLLADPTLRRTLATVGVAAATLSMLEPLLPLDLADRLGAGAAGIGLAFGAATLAHGLASPGVGALADRLPRARLVAAGLVGMGAVLPLLALTGSVVATGAVLVAFAVAYTAVVVPGLAQLGRVAERHGGSAQATVFGAFNVAYALGMVAGPLAGGAATTAGSLHVTLAGAAVLLVAGGLFLLRTRPTTPLRKDTRPWDA